MDDAELGDQVMLLVDRADASPQLSQASTGGVPGPRHRTRDPRGRAQRSVQQAKQGGFAGSTGSNHGHTLTCLYVEGDPSTATVPSGNTLRTCSSRYMEGTIYLINPPWRAASSIG